MTTVDEGVARVQKTHEVVAERLRRQIVSGQLEIGSQLPAEEELTSSFGIARTTLREALRVLEAQGLLTIRRGRGGGPVVTAPSLAPMSQALAINLQLQGATLGDLDEARQIIESQITARLAREHTADDLAALRACIARAAATAEADDTPGFGDAAARFHQTLVQRGGNRTLTTVSLMLQELVDTYYRTSSAQADQRSMRRACRAYTKLVDLIEAGDAEAAQTYWRQLMTFTITNVGRDRTLDMYAGG